MQLNAILAQQDFTVQSLVKVRFALWVTIAQQELGWTGKLAQEEPTVMSLDFMLKANVNLALLASSVMGNISQHGLVRNVVWTFSKYNLDI